MADHIDDPHVLEPGHAPTPFTAEEIREGCPSGRTLRLLVEAPGEPPFLRVSRFIDSDEDGTTLERSRQSLDGETIETPVAGRASWRELQANTSFPSEVTTIVSERIDTAIGEYDCLRYTVPDGAAELIFWFAKDLPGPPLQYWTRKDGQVIATMSVVDNAMP